jgi:lipopolysaccharide transport system ATP-binding protein
MSHSIVVDNLTKCYRLGEDKHTMIRDAVVGSLRKLFGREQRPARSLKWALNGVSCKIERGEVVGIIGRNGAGKSTLLKILSGITYPTTGCVDVKGRVGSLLEVGTGFHDELTGRENIYMNGSILGMRKREIEAAMNEIVAFADIGEFLDTPIKRYSSGMRMRLGFSVAAHLCTDVLFVDEVLAVGDLGFQKKCLGAMRELGKGGRTVVFVSHNMSSIQNLCKRTIWIADGVIKQDGDSKDVISAYVNSFGAATKQGLELGDLSERQGTGAVRFTKMEFLNDDGSENHVVRCAESLAIRLHYECQRDLVDVHFAIRIFSNLGALVSDVNTWGPGAIPLVPRGSGSIDLEIDFLSLMPGTYSLGLCVSSFHEAHDELHNVTRLDVEPSDFYGTGRGMEATVGLVFLPCRWDTAARKSRNRASNGTGSRPENTDDLLKSLAL